MAATLYSKSVPAPPLAHGQERELDVLLGSDRGYAVGDELVEVAFAHRQAGVAHDAHRVARLPSVALLDLGEHVLHRRPQRLRAFLEGALTREAT